MIIEINFGKGFGYERTDRVKVIRLGFFYVVFLKKKLDHLFIMKEMEGKNKMAKQLKDSVHGILKHLPDESLESFTALLDMAISMTGTGYQYPKSNKS